MSGNIRKLVVNPDTGDLDVISEHNPFGINYVGDNFTFENGLSGYSTYADAAGVDPVDGTGGVPNVTLATSVLAADLLRGQTVLCLTKDAANRQGEGFSRDIVIDEVDQGKPIKYELDFKTDANYVDGDMGFFIYDKTNLKLVYPNIIDIPATGMGGTFRGSFPASIDSVDYTFIFHIRTVSALAYKFCMDHILIGPYKNASGSSSFASKTVPFTPIGSWTTNTNYSGNYYRENGHAIVRYQIDLTGAPGGGPILTLDPPPGLVVKNSDLVLNGQGGSVVGVGEILDTGTARIPVSGIWDTATNKLGIQYHQDFIVGVGAIALSTTTTTTPAVFANGDAIELTVKYPIEGWEMGTAPNEVITGQSLTATYSQSSGQAIANGAIDIIDFETIEVDRAGSVSTGAVWKYTGKESGDFDVAAVIQGSHGGGGLDEGEFVSITVYKNNILYKQLDCYESVGNPTNNINICLSGNTTVPMVAGDFIDVRVFNSNATGANPFTLNPNIDRNHIAIKRDSNSSALMQPNDLPVRMRYKTNAGQLFTTSVTAVVLFEDKEYDNYSIYNPATGIATIPRPGQYKLGTLLRPNSQVTAGDLYALYIYKNGAIYQDIVTEFDGTNGGMSSSIQNTATIDCIAGDTLEVRFLQTTGFNSSLLGNNNENVITIEEL